jgi:hypothetical protein
MMRGMGLVWLAVVALTACGSANNGGGGGGIDLGDGSAPMGGATCASVCTRSIAACPGTNMGDCVSQCQAFINAPGCASQATATLNCLSAATFTCTDAGSAMTMACQAEREASGLCALGDAALPGDASAD